MKILLIVLSLLFGCAQYDAIKHAVATSGADAADRALQAAAWQLCNAATYGAIKRMFADDKDKSDALIVLCSVDETENVIE